MNNKSSKIRSKNFTTDEVTLLVEEVEKRRHILFGPLKGPSLTQHHRDRAWEKVLEAVNAVAPVVRGIAEIKKKFRDLKSRTKQKANAVKRESRKTGGGENDAVENPLSATEEKLLTFIGSESIEGIPGGIDTFRLQVINKPAPPLAPPTIISVPNVPVPVTRNPHVKPCPVPLVLRVEVPNPQPSSPSSTFSSFQQTEPEPSTSYQEHQSYSPPVYCPPIPPSTFTIPQPDPVPSTSRQESPPPAPPSHPLPPVVSHH